MDKSKTTGLTLKNIKRGNKSEGPKSCYPRGRSRKRRASKNTYVYISYILKYVYYFENI